MAAGAGNRHVRRGTRFVVLARVVRSKTLFFTLLLGLGGTAAVAYRAKPTFRSEAVLLYQQRGGAQADDESTPRMMALRLEEMLSSRQLLQKLIDEFHLYPEAMKSGGLAEAAEEMRRDLRFETREGYAYRVSYDAETPALAQAVAARASALLMEVVAAGGKQDAGDAKRFLEEEKKRAEDEVKASQQEYARYVAAHPDLSPSAAALPTPEAAPPRAAEGGDGNAAALEAQAAQLREKIRQAAAQSGKSEEAPPAPLPEVPDDPALVAEREAAQADLAAAQRDLTQKQAQFTPEYPDVQKAQAAVSAAKDRFRRAVENLARKRAAAMAAAVAAAPPPAPAAATAAESGDPQLEGLRSKLRQVERQIATARARAKQRVRPAASEGGRSAEAAAQVAVLERKVREAKERQTLLDSKQFQTTLLASFQSKDSAGELTIVDPAYLPTAPMHASRANIALIGGGLALALAFGLAIGVVLHDDTLYSGYDVERLGLPSLLAELPRPTRAALRSFRG